MHSDLKNFPGSKNKVLIKALFTPHIKSIWIFQMRYLYLY